jgi:hypothetical protein
MADGKALVWTTLCYVALSVFCMFVEGFGAATFGSRLTMYEHMTGLVAYWFIYGKIKDGW